GSTPRARARSSRWRATRPPKAAPRTAAPRSRSSARAGTSPSLFCSNKKPGRGRVFCFYNSVSMNADPAELEKFSKLAHRWWDPQGEFRPLHEINPLRLEWIDRHAPLAGKKVIDIGCGGGILAEAMAQRGAQVTGIDLSDKALRVAELHLLESGANVTYEKVSAEGLAAREPGR